MLKLAQFDAVTRIDSARTLAGRGRYWTTAYLVDDLLIDSGCAHTAPELARVLAGRPLAGIVNTHSHEDHIGANALLQAGRNLPVWAHPAALPQLALPRRAVRLQPYRLFLWGRPEPSVARPLADGELIETPSCRFEVLYTHGHSPDHICLLERQRGWLFTGDLFIGGKDRALRVDYDVWQIIASLRRMAALPGLTRLFPGCARVRDDAAAALAAKIDYLQELGDKILALRRQGHSPRAIACALLGGPLLIELLTLGHFSRLGLVCSFLAEMAQ